MFEQVCGLVVDLERILVVEEIEVERFRHTGKCITNGYTCSAQEARISVLTPCRTSAPCAQEWNDRFVCARNPATQVGSPRPAAHASACAARRRRLVCTVVRHGVDTLATFSGGKSCCRTAVSNSSRTRHRVMATRQAAGGSPSISSGVRLPTPRARGWRTSRAWPGCADVLPTSAHQRAGPQGYGAAWRSRSCRLRSACRRHGRRGSAPPCRRRADDHRLGARGRARPRPHARHRARGAGPTGHVLLRVGDRDRRAGDVPQRLGEQRRLDHHHQPQKMQMGSASISASSRSTVGIGSRSS